MKKIIVIFAASCFFLTVNLSAFGLSDVLTFSKEGQHYAQQAEHYGSMAQNLKNKITGWENKYTNLTNGFGFDNFNFAGFNLGAHVRCNLPTPSTQFNICNELEKKTGFNFLGQLNANLNIAGCKENFSLSPGNKLTQALQDLCNLGQGAPAVSWSPHELNMQELLKGNTLKNNSKSTKVNENGRSFSIKNTVYNKSKHVSTKTLYQTQTGTLSNSAMVKGQTAQGIKVANAARYGYIKNNYAIYSAYARSIKANGAEIAYKETKPSTPAKTYLQYIAKMQASVMSISGSKPTELAYETNIKAEIQRLKNKYELRQLKGTTPSAMIQDYNMKIKEILTALLSIRIAPNSSKKADVSVYAKAVQDTRLYDLRIFDLHLAEWKRKFHVIIEPSQAKLDMLPATQRWQAADKILMQFREETAMKVAFKNKIQKMRYRLRQKALEIFYNSLQYNPMIANAQIKELLK